MNEGVVVAVGPGRRTKEGELLAPSVREGDKVLLPEYGGAMVKLNDKECVAGPACVWGVGGGERAGGGGCGQSGARWGARPRPQGPADGTRTHTARARARRLFLYRDDEILGVLTE